MRIFYLTLSFFLTAKVHTYFKSGPLVASKLERWITRKDCDQVHLTGMKTWHWESCENKQTQNAFCRLKSERIRLNKNTCSVTVKVEAQVFKTKTNHTNMLQVKINSYYHNNNNNNNNNNESKIIDTIGKIQKTSNYQWDRTKNSDVYYDISITFEDKHNGFCGEIQSLVVISNPCNATTISIGESNEENLGNKNRIQMTCTTNNTVQTSNQNTVNVKNLVVEKRSCWCPPGYYQENNNEKCFLCPKNYFKKDIDNNTCTICGNNSISSKDHTTCQCIEKFFRRQEQQYNYEAPCIDTKPRNLNSKLVDGNNIVFSWNSPNREMLSIGVIRYRAECSSCEPYEYTRERKKNEKNNNITLALLNFNRFYHVQVIASYISKKRGKEKEIILHVINKSFFIAHHETEDDRTFIVVISIIVPSIITCVVIVMLLYANQKKKNVYFQQKLTSLRRKSRPPPPPRTGTYRRNQCNGDAVDDDDMASTIKPYAVLNFKLNSLKKEVKESQTGNTAEEKINLLQNKEVKKNDNHAEVDDYVSMEANKPITRKDSSPFIQYKCIQNDYIIRPYNDYNHQFHNMPPLRSRTRSCNIGNQSFLDRPNMEMVNNDRNERAHFNNRSLAGSCYLNSRKNLHASTRDMYHHKSTNIVQAQWTRTNSYYNQNGAWNNLPYFNGPMIHPRNSYDNQSYFDENDRFDNREMMPNAWHHAPLMGSRPRTRSCLVNEQNNYYRPEYGRKFQPDFPSFPENDRSRTESFYNNDPAVLDTPRDEPPPMMTGRRNRSRTVCEEERTIDKLSILDQAKLKSKYKRAESKEILCATDYVKLKRPHSADDVNIVHGMGL